MEAEKKAKSTDDGLENDDGVKTPAAAAASSTRNKNPETIQLRRSKRKRERCFIKFPEKVIFFESMRQSFMRNVRLTGLSEYTTDLIFRVSLSRDEIYLLLETLEQKLNTFFNTPPPTKKIGATTYNARSVEIIVSPLYSYLERKIISSRMLNDVCKFNVIAICASNLFKYSKYEDATAVLKSVLGRLLRKTKRDLGLK